MSMKCRCCGSEIPAGSYYCPDCGTRIVEDRARLGMVPNLILIYGVVALIIGLFFAMSIAVLDEFWIENVGPDGTYYGVTYGQLESTMVWMTAAFLSSGLCATVSGILARRMVYGRVCLILCLLASVLVFVAAVPDMYYALYGVVPFIVGMYMTYRLYVCQDAFSG